ncbi:MAG: hypothetical protein FWD06_06410 [Oscillospiraceae bacterium]|nr:hypothetical protein [Oscillospiraceae bacterium]
MRRLIAGALAAIFGFFGFALIDATIENRVEILEAQVASLEARLDEHLTTVPYTTTTQPTTTTAARSISILGGNRTINTGTQVGFMAIRTPDTAQVRWRIVAGAEFVELVGANANGVLENSVTANVIAGPNLGAARLEASIPGATAYAARIVATVDIIINTP